MPEPAVSLLHWFADFLGRRMWWAALLAVVFIGFVLAAEGVSWTSAIITFLVIFFLAVFLMLAETFRRIFAATGERREP